MKRATFLLSLGVFLAVSCAKRTQESQISNVSFTPCVQSRMTKNVRASGVNVEFTNQGVQIAHYKFEVPCDFTTVNVTHTLVNGVLRITQRSTPEQADCICYTDLSYTINGILQNQVNVIFINDVQVYCWNDNNQPSCDQNVIVCETEYENTPNYPISIIDMKIEGNCLKIKFGASGCDLRNVKLIAGYLSRGGGNPFWTLKIFFDNPGLCALWITKEMSFNIEDLQIQGRNSVTLNISDNSILYEY